MKRKTAQGMGTLINHEFPQKPETVIREYKLWGD